MDALEELKLRDRRHKLLQQCQEYMANVGSDKTHHLPQPLQTGQIAGRSVQQINSDNSKESRLYHNHVVSTKEDRLLEHFVNTAKKIEPHQSHKNIQKHLNKSSSNN